MMTSITSQVNAGDTRHVWALDLDRPVLVYKLFFILLPLVMLFAPEAVGLSMLLLVFALPFDGKFRRAFERPSYQLVMRSLVLFLGWSVLSLKWSPQGVDQNLLSFVLLCVVGSLGVISAASMTGTQRAQVQPFALLLLVVCVIGLIAASLAPQGFMMRLTGENNLQALPVRTLSILVVLVWPLIGVIFSKRSGLSGRLAVLLSGVLIVGLALVAFKLAVVSIMLALALGGAAVLLVALLPRVGLAAISCLIVAYLLLAPILHMDVLREPGEPLAVTAPQSWAYRMEVWSHAARATFETPIRGRGFEGAGLSSQNLGAEQDSSPSPQVVLAAPHNLFLRVWLELGLVGVVLLVGILFGVISAIWRGIHNGLEAGIASAVLVSFLTLSLLSNGAWALWWSGTAWLAAITVIVCRYAGVYKPPSQILSGGAFSHIGVMASQGTRNTAGTTS